MGAGLEIASCCDIRLAGAVAKFGAPIAKLGFPMAPREAALVRGAVGDALARDMLLAAQRASTRDDSTRPASCCACCPTPRSPREALAPRRSASPRWRPQAARAQQAYPAADRRRRPNALLATRLLRLRRLARAPRGHRRLPRQARRPSSEPADAMTDPTNANLFAALRAAFPADLDAIAVETDDGLLLLLARPGPRQRDDRQPLRCAGAEGGRAHRGAGREVGRGA